jgi:uncharacterized protein
MRLPTVRDNNAQELRAFDEVCQRLGGFEAHIGFEWVDGFLTALAAGPHLPAVDDWLPALCGDAFERAFADPEAHASALRALKTRLTVLRDQLDPEILFDQPDALRLAPLMTEWNEAERTALIAEQGLDAEEAAELQTGALWAIGFLDGVEAFPQIWTDPVDEETAGFFGELIAQVEALVLPTDSPEMAEHVARVFADGPPTRDDLIAQASYAVQDLRVYWVHHAVRPATRRVTQTAGRNDPCPCGSGKKFKKCHGAAAA